jgi:hypothetical protein
MRLYMFSLLTVCKKSFAVRVDSGWSWTIYSAVEFCGGSMWLFIEGLNDTHA